MEKEKLHAWAYVQQEVKQRNGWLIHNYFLCRPFILAEQLSQYHLPLGTVLRLTQAK
jgi:hypothetical protein